MSDFRVKVTVQFTIDVGIIDIDDNKLYATQDKANEITQHVFQESFSRAHVIDISTEEMFKIIGTKK